MRSPRPNRRPGAAAAAPAGAQPAAARYQRLFIVTYGRSGSTLLQGVLNSVPGYVIRGENHDLLGQMLAFYEEAPRFRDGLGVDRKGPGKTPADPFFGFERYRDDTYARGLARMLDTLLAGDGKRAGVRCLGFKEIRYTPENVAEKVDFLRLMYPGCGIVFNTRNPEAVSASEFQKNKPPAYFQRFNAVLEDMAGVDPHACLVRYEDVVAGTGTLPGLFKFLRETLDRQVLAAVLARKHSYHTDQKGSIYSNVPAAAQVERRLQGLAVFIVDRLAVSERTTQIDGFMLESAGAPARRFASLVDGSGASVAFTAEYGLPSPKIAALVGGEAAAKCRFQLSFARPGGAALTLLLDDQQKAATVQAAPSPMA